MNWVDKIYIISLNRHEARKRHIFADLHSASFDVSKIEWVHAVDGSKLDIDELITDGKINPTFKDPYGAITKSVYGCALSHQKTYKTFLETSDNIQTALVLEDDASVTHTLLRMLHPNSTSNKMLTDEINRIDWDVIMMGGQYKKMEYIEGDNNLLKEMVRYPLNYAAHSYVITKEGAKKLIESNQPIQFAADVNIHCSDVKLYCTPISYFSQKIGEMDKWMMVDLYTKFKSDVLYKQENWNTEDIISSTTHGDSESNSTDATDLLSLVISKQLKVDSIDFKSFTAPNGDVIENWPNIHLKK